MTKTWIAVLAIALGLHGTALVATAQPELLSSPPTEIPIAPLPLDTKVPLVVAAPATTNACAPAPTACGTPCAAPCPTACETASKPCASCPTASCKTALKLDLGLGTQDHPCLTKFCAWITYRPCQLTPLGCCYYARPMANGYEYFLGLGCLEGPGASCCKAGCGSCGSSCGK